jgi:hypothetical protein
MAKQYKEGPKGVSFKGIMVYPYLSEPSYGSKDHPKPEGQFKVALRAKADDADVKLWIAKWQPLHDAAIARAKEAFKGLKVDVRKKLKEVTVNPLVHTIYDEETEEPTGDIEVRFTMPFSGTYKSGKKEGEKWYRAPDIFDAKGNKLPYFNRNKITGVITPNKAAPGIWGGTVGRVSFEVGLDKEQQPGYFVPATGAAGLSLRMQAVRIITLVSGGQRSASDYGFDGEEEGGDDIASQFSAGDTETGTDTTAETGEQTTSSQDTAGDNNPDF